MVGLISLTPFMAAAQTTTTSTESQLVPLYLQLIEDLKEELMVLVPPGHAWLSIIPVYAHVPAYVSFVVQNPSGTEAIDFGDGHSTGSNGCTKNAQGWCELSGIISHSYDTPANYVVSLYDHVGNVQHLLSTTTITVVH